MVAYDDAKLREMVLYVAEQCRTDHGFGMTKLNKILYYADFRAHRELGRSISDTVYIHLSQGPVVDNLSTLTEHLRQAGDIAMEHVWVGPYRQERVVPLRDANRELFTHDELAIINQVVGSLKGLGAKQVSDRSHQELGWRLTRQGEVIHYRTAWLSANPLSDEEVEAGREIAERYGLLESAAI